MKAEEALQLAKAYTRKYGGGGGTTLSTPDWNASEGEEGYIKNRPFYSETKETEILPETTVTLENQGATTIPRKNLIVGQVYTVTFNNTNYACVCKEVFENETSVGVGLGEVDALMNGTEPSGVYPFVMIMIDESLIETMEIESLIYVINPDITEVTIRIMGIGECLKTLDNKYLNLDWIPCIIGKEEFLSGTYSTGRMEDVAFDDFSIGEELVVSCDGVEYTVSVKDLGNGGWYFGNPARINKSNVDTGEPFAAYNSLAYTVILFGDNIETNHKIIIYKDTYNKMPKGFLPDDIEPLPESFEGLTLYDPVEGEKYTLSITLAGDFIITNTKDARKVLHISSFDSAIETGYIPQYNEDDKRAYWRSPTTVVYNAAKDCGFTGTEDEFKEKFKMLLNTADGNEVAY